MTPAFGRSTTRGEISSDNDAPKIGVPKKDYRARDLGNHRFIAARALRMPPSQCRISTDKRNEDEVPISWVN